MSGDWSPFKKSLSIKGSEYLLIVRPMLKGPHNGISFALFQSPGSGGGVYGQSVAVLNARVGVDEMFVVRLQVDEIIKGNGLGSELLNQAMDFCREHDIGKLRLVATPESESFYKKYFNGKRAEHAPKSSTIFGRLADSSSVWTVSTVKVSDIKLERDFGRLNVFKPLLKRENAFCFSRGALGSGSSASPSPTTSTGSSGAASGGSASRDTDHGGPSPTGSE